MGIVPTFHERSHLWFLVVVVLIGCVVAVITFWMESYRVGYSEHWQVGLAMLVIAVISYVKWRGSPDDDVYAVLFWVNFLIGLTAIVIDARDILAYFRGL